MQKPTIGRIVHYYLTPEDRINYNNGAEIAPAIITRVWSDTLVNLKVFNDGSDIQWKTSVEQKQEGENRWEWPPVPLVAIKQDPDWPKK